MPEASACPTEPAQVELHAAWLQIVQLSKNVPGFPTTFNLTADSMGEASSCVL